MKKILLFLICQIVIFMTGCAVIGNGIAVEEKISLTSKIKKVSIDGDWRVELICGANENSMTMNLDSDLVSLCSVRNSSVLKVTLPERAYPMAAPVLRIKLTGVFEELELDGRVNCYVKGFDSKGFAFVQSSGSSVCVFESKNINSVEVEIGDNAKVSFKCPVAEMQAEVEEYGVLEAADIGKLQLEISENAIGRIGKCAEAVVEAEDNAKVSFKSVTSLAEAYYDNASISYPVVVPADLKQENGKK